MTKKAQKILKELEVKLHTAKWLYEGYYITAHEYYEEVTTITNNCSDMVSYMFRFHLLSESDFTTLNKLVSEKFIEYIEYFG